MQYQVFDCPQIPFEGEKFEKNCMSIGNTSVTANGTYVTQTRPVTQYNSIEAGRLDLGQNYPLNKTWTCYYPYDEDTKVLDSRYSEEGFFGSAIAFFVFLGLSFLGIVVGGAWHLAEGDRS